jgi:3D (Asp-Asp-Asp) domain-containing protein
MNLDSDSLYITKEQLQNRLVAGVSLEDVLSPFNIPTSNTFTVATTGLLPANLSTSDEDGFIKPLPAAVLEEEINKNLNTVSDVIKNNIDSSIKSAISTEGQLSNTSREEIETFTTELKNNIDGIISKTQEFFISLSNFTKDNLIISKFNTAVNNVIEKNIDSFTNKQIRDLNSDEQYFAEIVEQIFLQAVSELKDTVISELGKSTSTSSSVIASINGSTLNFKTSPYTIPAYLRVYYSLGQGSDPEAITGLSVMNTKLISGRTCAVDNSTILLNSKVTMPDGKEFLAVDSFIGSAVRPAVYLYFYTRQEAEDYLTSLNYNINNKVSLRVVPPALASNIPKFDRPESTNISIRGLEKDLV